MTTRRFLCLAVLCITATALNYLLNTLCVYKMNIPLFLDTVFSVAVCFAAGLIPGLITALLTNLACCIRDGGLSPFILCSLAEVFLVWKLNPLRVQKNKPLLSNKSAASFFGTFAGLMLLYICACVMVSVLGGLIDFFYYGIIKAEKQYFSAEDTIKINLLQSGIPVLAMNILSRILVNAVDRFIVIFGGFGISLGIKWLLDRVRQ